MALLDFFTPEEIAAELRALGYTVTPPAARTTPPTPVQTRPAWLVETADDEGLQMLGRGEDE
jgi:hypothetical protein